MSAPIIDIRKLGFSLSGHEILSGVSLAVEAGEYVSVIGPNGAGKTTLIKCLAGIHQDWGGEIDLCGKPYNTYSARERGRLISYVPQAEGRASALTVEAFVTMGRYPHLSAFTSMRPDDYRAVNHAIDQAGLGDFRHRTLDTLSGGERQMAFIAAALAQETQILLLDEPSTFLDYRHQSNVTSLLRQAGRDSGITIIAVHHDVNTATACSDRIHALKDGRIVFSGTAEETSRPDTLEAVYDTAFVTAQAAGRKHPVVISGGAS